MKKKFLSRLADITKVHQRAAFADVEEQIKRKKYGSDAFMQILQNRYSCHAFNHYPVSASKLEMILEAGRLAPSAKNLQPTRIWVIKSEEAWTRESDGVNAAKTDAAIVLAHLMLTATDAGLANMWIWDFDPRKVREVFPEMREHGIYGLLAIGHPAAGEGRPTELHEVRKSLDQIVTEL